MRASFRYLNRLSAFKSLRSEVQSPSTVALLTPTTISQPSSAKRHRAESSRARRRSCMAQPEWRAPQAPRPEVQARLPKLSVYNSLTRSKTPFIPLDPDGKNVGWYVCGPTVYDDSHLGHARNYVSTDIIRRILQDHFGFQVKFVMNITDVDDKIIVAARQQHLLAQWLEKHKEVDESVRETTRKAFETYIRTHLPLLGQDTSIETYNTAAETAYGHVVHGKSLANDGSPPGDKEAKTKMHLNTANSAVQAMQTPNLTLSEFGGKASGVLLPYVDAQDSHTVRGEDHHIFTTFTKKYEQRFLEDMAALNVLPPDTLVRVTDYGPQIIGFVKQIQDKGFAYEHQGSVYFDTGAWEGADGIYARLKPWNRNDEELRQDGEGQLSVKTNDFKRSAADFALWKASKPGEISWQSPWGEGRPGWHIECSAMASNILGKSFDIHSGGIDLAFPHHDNELAQSEAYWCPAQSASQGVQWVNYFLHMGHLSIQGSKMSKSLKNFTTIREALSREEWTPRSLRIVCLLGAWKDGLEITTELIKAGQAWEERITNLFLKTRDLQERTVDGTPTGTETTADGGATPIEGELLSAQQKFNVALCDSFDTPAAMRVISELVTSYNSSSSVPPSVSLNIARWITSVVRIFGLDDADVKSKTVGWSGIEIPEEAKPFIVPLARLRDRVREQAIAGSVDITSLGKLEDKETVYGSEQPYAKANAEFQRSIIELHARNATSQEYLAACDNVRDVVLWNLNIYLEDREGQPALVRPLSALLRQQRKDRESLAAARALAKQKARADAEAAEAKRLEKGKLSHLDMFRTSEYSAWDEDGLPTSDAAGKEVAKSKAKKLRKEWEAQKKLRNAYLQSLNGKAQ